jgi:hypothetical protein
MAEEKTDILNFLKNITNNSLLAKEQKSLEEEQGNVEFYDSDTNEIVNNLSTEQLNHENFNIYDVINESEHNKCNISQRKGKFYDEFYTFEPKASSFEKSKYISGYNNLKNTYVNKKIMSILDKIYNLKIVMLENTKLIEYLYTNLENDLKLSNVDISQEVIANKCKNSINVIKTNILNVFENLEQEVSCISTFSRSLQNYTKQYDMNTSLHEMVKLNFEYKFDSFNSELKNLRNENLKFQKKDNERDFENIRLMKQNFEERLKEKDAQINKLKNNLKKNEEILLNSKNLIEDIYSKNQKLKDKLVKYIKIVDGNKQH